MQHAPYPNQPVWPRPQVPYICQEGFETLLLECGWERYPEVNNINLETVSYHTMEPHEVDRFLQEWAFFGLLRECLSLRSIPFYLSGFINEDTTGRKFVDSTMFLTLFDHWKGIGRDWRTPQQCLDDRRRLRGCVIPVLQVMARCRASIPWSNSAWEILSDSETHLLCVTLFMESVLMMLHEFAIDEDDMVTENAGLALQFAPHVASFPPLKLKIKSSGWCPSRLISFDPLYVSIALFISACRPHDPHDTSRCTEESCNALQIDEARYATAHASGCQGCGDFKAVDAESLLTLISEDRMPVVVISCWKGAVDIRLEASDAHPSYVPISHVWAHGLGNVSNNSLPVCQLRRLADVHRRVQSAPLFTKDKFGRGVSPDTFASFFGSESIADQIEVGEASTDSTEAAIWIDTLCVPVSGERAYEEASKGRQALSSAEKHQWLARRQFLRKQAIKRMKSVYADARRVVAIDTLTARTGILSSGLENAVQIETSAWCRRLWTLQESRLSNGNLFFDDGRECHSVASLLISPRQTPVGQTFPITCFTGSSLIQLLTCAAHLTPEPESTDRDKIFHVMSTLIATSTRSTSHADDEAPCLAVLLGVRVDRILDCSGSDRMAQLYRELGEMYQLPTALLFLSGRRLATNGLRWAPQTLLNKRGILDRFVGASSMRVEHASSISRLCESGLLVTGVTKWIMLSLKVPDFKHTFKMTVAVQTPALEDGSRVFRTINIERESWLPLEALQTRLESCKAPAILWYGSWDGATLVRIGVLVEVSEQESTTLLVSARYICRVAWGRKEIDRTSTETEQQDYSPQLERGERSEAIEYDERTTWCIDG